jgi:hypothetical protein
MVDLGIDDDDGADRGVANRGAPAASPKAPSCVRMSGEALNNTQSSPSPTAIDDWVRACARIAPWRRQAQLRQLQFHCGKPPPAAAPSTCTRIAAESLWVGAAIVAKTPGRRPGRVPNVPARRAAWRSLEPMAERLLFLTGKLAEPGPGRILAALQGPGVSVNSRE